MPPYLKTILAQRYDTLVLEAQPDRPIKKEHSKHEHSKHEHIKAAIHPHLIRR